MSDLLYSHCITQSQLVASCTPRLYFHPGSCALHPQLEGESLRESQWKYPKMLEQHLAK